MDTNSSMATIRNPQEVWEESFGEQIAQQANNTAPVETLIRNVSYYLRARWKPEEFKNLNFLEMGCGTGPNLKWLAQKGIRVSGVDISPTALKTCRSLLESSGLGSCVGKLVEGSIDKVPFPDASVDGIVESCVFQHLPKEVRLKTFAEVKRLLKPGGLFAGHMLDVGHTIYQKKKDEELSDDPGTLILDQGGSHLYLSNLGLSHFYHKKEIEDLLRGFAVVDPCITTYYLPKEEASRRGYSEYLQSMWAVYAIR
jgi:SAM-dependent methyltransferase